VPRALALVTLAAPPCSRPPLLSRMAAKGVPNHLSDAAPSGVAAACRVAALQPLAAGLPADTAVGALNVPGACLVPAHHRLAWDAHTATAPGAALRSPDRAMQAANGAGCMPQAAMAAAASRHHDGDLQGRQSIRSPQIMRPIAGPSDARIRAGQPGSPCLGPLPQRAWRLGALTDRPAKSTQLHCRKVQRRRAAAAGRRAAYSHLRKAPSSMRQIAGLLPLHRRTGPHGRTTTAQQKPPTGVHRACALARGGGMARLGPPTSQRQSPQPRWPPWPQRVRSPSARTTCRWGKRPRSSARITFGVDPYRARPGATQPTPGDGSPLHCGPALGCRATERAARRRAAPTKGAVQGVSQPGPVPAPPPPAAVRAHHGHPAITHSRAVLWEMHARCRGWRGRGVHTLACHRHHGGLQGPNPGLV
jgi:hypothetical protein